MEQRHNEITTLKAQNDLIRGKEAILRINHLLHCWIFHHFLQSFHG
jgi:hypothetical protein